jgi:peptidoglycan/xylan/chitin deacetylase (PgdA/CDA1 family)
VFLTFDDGFADFATTAAPLLHKYGMTGIDYVVSGFIGSPNYMTADQLRQVETLGVHIGAHTVHHAPLAKQPANRLAPEIAGSKAELERVLGHPVQDFAYPFGSHSPAVEAAVKAAGFRSAVTTEYGWRQSTATPFALPRLRVLGGENLTVFAAAVGMNAVQAAPASPARGGVHCVLTPHC